MDKVLTVLQLKESENNAKMAAGFSEDIMIENAAFSAYQRISQSIMPSYPFAKKSKEVKILVLAGGGNNGADGLSIARLLHINGYNVTVAICSNRMNIYADARLNICKNLNMHICEYDKMLSNPFKNINTGTYDIIIDAIIGIGLSSRLRTETASIIQAANACDAYKISIDIPSGLNADTGEALGEVIKADETITFIAYKRGMLLKDAVENTGQIYLADIGVKPFDSGINIIKSGDVSFKKRKRAGHKYDYGNIKIIAGNMIGASVMAFNSAVSALKSGSGLVTICAARSQAAAYQSLLIEPMLLPIPEKDGNIVFDSIALDRIIQKADSILIGQGFGKNDDAIKIIEYLCKNYTNTLIIDADGLNALANYGDYSLIKNASCNIVLTPHSGEFDRLTKGLEFIEGDIIDRVSAFSKLLNVCIIYKSNISIIASGENVVLNIDSTPALAKGGTGDVLAGLVSSFCANKEKIAQDNDKLLLACAYACYLHSQTAKDLQKENGENGIMPTQIYSAYSLKI